MDLKSIMLRKITKATSCYYTWTLTELNPLRQRTGSWLRGAELRVRNRGDDDQRGTNLWQEDEYVLES